ncbi:MAG: hypothetical protein GY926_24565 [bacterium]|nr:hypothetical protein [bacterium]
MSRIEPGSRADTAVKAALSLVPYLGGALSIVYEDVRERRQERLQSFAESSFERYAGSPDELIERLSEDENLADLFIRSAESAATSLSNEKAVALGRLLADRASTSTDQPVDELELLTLALLDLEWPHIRGLSEMARFPSDAELEMENDSDQKKVSADARRAERFEALGELPKPVVAALVRHALLGQESGYGLYVDGVTDFGRTLLSYLEGTAADDDVDP